MTLSKVASLSLVVLFCVSPVVAAGSDKLTEDALQKYDKMTLIKVCLALKAQLDALADQLKEVKTEIASIRKEERKKRRTPVLARPQYSIGQVLIEEPRQWQGTIGQFWDGYRNARANNVIKWEQDYKDITMTVTGRITSFGSNNRGQPTLIIGDVTGSVNAKFSNTFRDKAATLNKNEVITVRGRLVSEQLVDCVLVAESLSPSDGTRIDKRSSRRNMRATTPRRRNYSSIQNLIGALPNKLLPARGDNWSSLIVQRVNDWFEQNAVGCMLNVRTVFQSEGQILQGSIGAHFRIDKSIKTKFSAGSGGTFKRSTFSKKEGVFRWAGYNWQVSIKADFDVSLANRLAKLKGKDRARLRGEIESIVIGGGGFGGGTMNVFIRLRNTTLR